MTTDKQSILAYIPLHYGIEYLSEAIKSVSPFVDKIAILYTNSPSYGHGSGIQCPETEQELYNVAMSAADNVEWHNVFAGNEGAHRQIALNMAIEQGYDLLLAVDSDEVFDQNDLPFAIDEVMSGTAKYYGIDGYINFWRSFEWACYDGFRPIRFIRIKGGDGAGEVKCTIYHFSTAQSNDIMRYKLQVHGHADEFAMTASLRGGKDWYNDIYLPWTPENNYGDLHLVSLALWNAVKYPKETLPDMLKNHPNYLKHIIE